MESKRRVGDRMSFALLILGNIATAIALSGLDCTNDGEKWMDCEFEAQNCSEYNMSLLNNWGYGEVHCIFKQCDSGRCCCSMDVDIILGETHTATVWRGGQNMGSKIINVEQCIKPRVPIITSVKESNGNFQVRWKTNMTTSLYMKAKVTYRKQGDTVEVSELFTPTTVDGLNFYEIIGQDLEPSTKYMVSVRSYIERSGRYSDSSKEWEFKTSSSFVTMVLAVTIVLSVVAIIISVGIVGSCIKCKTKWWDTAVKGQNPKLLDMHPSKQEVLKPVPPTISTVCVEPLIPDDSKPWSKGSDISSWSPQQSSGISTGSSCLSYANTEPADIIAGVQDALSKAFANIRPISPLNTNPHTELNKDSDLFSAPYNLCDVRTDDVSSGSSGFDNKSYSILIPSFPHQIPMDDSEVQTEAPMFCDSVYRPSEGDIVIPVDQQAPACPFVDMQPVFSSLMPTDMSYQQCNADSGSFSFAENSSVSSIASGTNTIDSCDPVSGVEAGCESSDEVVGGAAKLNGETEEAIVCDDNPCYGCVPAGSCSFPPVDDDYQAFQNLVEQPERSGEEEEHLSKDPEESFTKMPQSFFSPVRPGFMNNVQGGQCLSELQRPFLSLVSADQSMAVITDSGYQSV